MSHFGINKGESNYGVETQSYTAAIAGAVSDMQANNAAPNKALGAAVLRQESFRTAEDKAQLAGISNNVQSMAASIVKTLNFGHQEKATPSQGMNFDTEAMRIRAENAAKIGYALAMGHDSVVGRELKAPSLGADSAYLSGSLSGGSGRMQLRQEAFNNIDVRRSAAFSMGFNAAITKLTDVVMAWFPPIFLNPDQVTLEISLNLLTVFNGATHDISGKKTEFGRRNVVRAFADGNVLNRYETLAVPVSRPENADKLVDASVIPHVEKSFGNRKVKTAPILFDTEVNLVGLSTTDALLQTGVQSHRDVVEPGAKLASMYFKSDTDIIELKTSGLKTSTFVGAQQHDQQEVLLNFRTKVALGKTLKQYDGSDLAGPLKILAEKDLRVKLALGASGILNVETANAKVSKPSVQLVALVDAASQEEITSGPDFQAVKTAIAGLEALGFDIKTYRTNANRRQTGDRINSRRFTYHFPIVYRDPITAERPAHKQEDQDAQDLLNLQSLTRVRIENEAIDIIVETAETASTYVDMRDTDAEATDMIGLAQFYLLHAFAKENLDLTKYVDSDNSAERARDIQGAIVTKLRDVVARLYTESEFKAGTDFQSGGTLPKPQVNLLTDPILARYIMEPGELRTLGDFEMVLTTTLNYKIRGQMYISFRMPGQESSNEPCIFNFGHLLMSPELVLAANMTREGSYFAETQVQPRYEFLVLNPIMAHITVTGVKEVLSKVPRLTTFGGPLEIGNVVKMEAVGP